jgi:hypothetical protein
MMDEIATDAMQPSRLAMTQPAERAFILITVLRRHHLDAAGLWP